MRKSYFLFSFLVITILFVTNCKKDETKDPNQVAYENADKSLGGIM